VTRARRWPGLSKTKPLGVTQKSTAREGDPGAGGEREGDPGVDNIRVEDGGQPK
jgi:hypothetical protein